MRIGFAPYKLIFKLPVRTSRETLTEKPTFFIKVFDENDPSRFGIGEAAVFPGLSPEADGNYVNKLLELMANVALNKPTDLSRHSSIQFGLEQAILDFSNGCRGVYYPCKFTEGKKFIRINGLIWINDYDRMLEEIHLKIQHGFKTIKIKIGSQEFEKDLELLRYIRHNFSDSGIAIRLDANGAFSPDIALARIHKLADFDIHSIEQPIPQGNPEIMAQLVRESPVPIALDEELIGKGSIEERIETLERIKPQFIVLKPALCGGLSGSTEWIAEAEKRGIGWWITSALESNIGLNAVSQLAGSLSSNLPQGLGTGALFINNFDTPLYLDGELLKYDTLRKLDYSQFNNLRWHT